MDKLSLARKLYPKEHALQVERHAISLLQVELGELKILLDDVNQHTDADATKRTQQQFDAQAEMRRKNRDEEKSEAKKMG